MVQIRDLIGLCTNFGNFRNYPKTFQEFDEWFGNDDAYIDYIASMIPVKCLAE
jgi:hypothetical protein